MLLFLDSCQHYSSANLVSGRKYETVATSDATWTVEPTGSPTNEAHIMRTSNNSNAALNDYVVPRMSRTQTDVWTPTVSGVIGFHMKIDDLSKMATGSNTQMLLRFYGSDFTGQVELYRILLSPDGAFNLVRVDNPISFVQQAVSANVIRSGVWHHVQVKWDLKNSGGLVAVRVDRSTVASFSGNTSSTRPGTAVQSIRMFSVASTTSNLKIRMANLMIKDLQGSYNNDYLDDALVQFRHVTGAGAEHAWTPSTGSNYQNVDEISAPDDDGTYNSATAPNLTDTYQVEPVPTGATVYGQQIVALVRRTSAGTIGLKSVVRQAGTDYLGPEQGVSQDTYNYFLNPYDTNPATGVPWTESEANNDEYGVDKSA